MGRTHPSLADPGYLATPSDAPPVSELTRLGGPCGDPVSASIEIEAFTSRMDELILQLPNLPESARDLGLEATRQLREVDAGRQTDLCVELQRQQELSRLMGRALDQQRDADNRGPGACPSLEATLVIEALRQAVDQLKIVLDGVCESTACPPPFTPPLCPIACGLPAAAAVLSAVLDTSVAISGKCGQTDHEAKMAEARGEIGFSIAALAVDIDNSKSAGDNLLNNAAQQDDLIGFQASMFAGFDGGNRGPGSGLNPRLAALLSQVQDENLAQSQYQSQALRGITESQLAAGQPLARLQLPASAGGLLEIVRETVALRIQLVQNAGGNADAALVAFRGGDDALNQAQYRDAYAAYQQAYARLVPPGGGSGAPKEVSP